MSNVCVVSMSNLEEKRVKSVERTFLYTIALSALSMTTSSNKKASFTAINVVYADLEGERTFSTVIHADVAFRSK